MRQLLLIAISIFGFGTLAVSQELKVVTVTRPPFSMLESGKEAGFSIELWNAVAEDIGQEFSILRVEDFGEMLDLVKNDQVDLAIANISITADREKVMDFTQPIFESGLQIMIHNDGYADLSVLRGIFSRDMLSAIAIALAVLFGIGMLMWKLEHKAQPYFDRPAKQAMFPAFWWALNLVVNGGFEERMPRTVIGRLLGVVLVISSLFFVSIFVARVTAIMTVDAIQSSVISVNDLFGRRVGTIDGSTSSIYLENREMRYIGYSSLDSLLASFEQDNIDAVVFDAPILAYYVNNSKGSADLAGPVFRVENYGIALPTGSPLAERINQSLLRIREDGTYAKIYRKWFGNNPSL